MPEESSVAWVMPFLTLIVGLYIGYFVRVRLQEKKQKIDNINHFIDLIETTLDEIFKDIAAIKIVAISPVKLETHRMLVVVLNQKLQRACEQIHLLDKSIFPVPNDKLRAIRKSSSTFFDDPRSPECLGNILSAQTELRFHYSRQYY